MLLKMEYLNIIGDTISKHI